MGPGKFQLAGLALAVGVGLASIAIGHHALAASEMMAPPDQIRAKEKTVSPKKQPEINLPAQSTSATLQDVARPPPRNDDTRPFATRHARFEPARFGDLPGWQDDSVGDAWEAFRRSCNVLAKRPAWSDPCARSSQLGAGDNAAMRRFFEEEFVLYQINNIDHSPAGVITGYYEPLLYGSRQHGGRYVHPLYASPKDMLLLNVRALPEDFARRPIAVHIEGRNLLPIEAGDEQAQLYTLDLDGLEPDIRDKRLRVRIEGKRIVPYFTRAEIERDRRADAKVLVWVDNPVAAYSMQVQGSGKVRLTDGKTMRLAYAEQNGHPFLPPTLPATRSAAAGEAPLLRGIALALPEREPPVTSDNAEATGEPITRSIKEKASQPTADNRGQMSPEVAQMVEALLHGTDSKGKKAAAKRDDGPPARPASLSSPAPGRGKRSPNLPTTAPEVALPSGPASAFWSDPSYVFFREVPDSENGPIGALGVPLTAGRSLAVDPRTTPLGFPVFISTNQPGKNETLNRLMLAQDTGGAIRGAVRADYFWGFGPSAWAQASRMKQSGRMWLLLPKTQQISSRAIGISTRGVGGEGTAECVIADPDLCVE